jgi:ribosomal protein S18 acetylase RimI-like enzyme
VLLKQSLSFSLNADRAPQLKRSRSASTTPRKETNVIALRPLRWPDDRASLLALDTSFTTDRVFRLELTDHGVELDEVATELPIHKSYSLDDGVDVIPSHDWVKIAEHNYGLVGFASMTIEAWNRRAVLRHLYVTREARRIGFGNALVTAAMEAARDRNARCVWVETQTVNYGAVRFYQSMGFAWCGFDTSLYDPCDAGVDEVALFFSRDLL